MFQSRRFWFSYRLEVEEEDDDASEVAPSLLQAVPELELSISVIESISGRLQLKLLSDFI